MQITLHDETGQIWAGSFSDFAHDNELDSAETEDIRSAVELDGRAQVPGNLGMVFEVQAA